MDSERPDEHGTDDVDATGVAYGDALAEETLAAPEPPKTRMLLGALAGLGVALAAAVLYAVVAEWRGNEFPGITVVAALLIGYVVREVSRRSDLLPRAVSALVTAALCYVGPVASVALAVSRSEEVERLTGEKTGFFEALKAYIGDGIDIINDRDKAAAWTWAIFAAAVVVAFLSAAPAKPKKSKAAPAPAEPVDPAMGDEG